jgi:Mn-dependent DtxR family transcriptional regulator
MLGRQDCVKRRKSLKARLHVKKSSQTEVCRALARLGFLPSLPASDAARPDP